MSDYDNLPGTWLDDTPLPLVMYCPAGHQHIDEGEWATKPHKTHQCQVKVTSDREELRAVGYWDICGLEWRPADFPTVGVAEPVKQGENK